MNDIEKLMQEIEEANISAPTAEQSERMYNNIKTMIEEHEEYEKIKRFLKYIFEE